MPAIAEMIEPNLAAEAVVALVQGQPLTELPQNLYIPPHALRIFLDSFEGPLDLLLYLIRQHNLDILVINVAAVSQQYVAYIDLMEASGLDLAAEYLLMAALLIEIKSRSLLPQPPVSEEDSDEDPAERLVSQLKTYQWLKQATVALNELPRQGREWFLPSPERPLFAVPIIYPQVTADELNQALHRLLIRQTRLSHHIVIQEPLTLADKIIDVRERLIQSSQMSFTQLIAADRSVTSIVLSLMAILELAHRRQLQFEQSQPYTAIMLYWTEQGIDL